MKHPTEGTRVVDDDEQPSESDPSALVGSGHISRRVFWSVLVLIVAGLVAWLVAVVATWPGVQGAASYSAATSGGIGDSESLEDASVRPTAGVTQWPIGERPALPAVQGQTLDGGQLDLADLRGGVMVLNTWGSWCEPCREEATALERVWQDTRSAGVRFVGINVRDAQTPARAFVAEFGITYPSLVDEDLRLVAAMSPAISAQAIPTTVVVDPQGGVAARIMGKASYATLRRLVDGVLAEDPRAAPPKPSPNRDLG